MKKKTTDTPASPMKPTCNPATLGTMMVSYQEITEVKVGETDSGDLVTWRPVTKYRERIGPEISLEEAQSLEDSFGKQDWKLWSDTENYFCMFNNEVVQRRFIITQETYDKLKGDGRMADDGG